MSARIHFLDGIRGWAALIVVFNHLAMCFLPESWSGAHYTKDVLLQDLASYRVHEIVWGIFSRVMTDGSFAVLLFFVVSGYALSSGQLNFAKRDLARATTSRYFRLMIPIMVTSLIAFALIASDMLYNHRLAATDPTYALIGTLYPLEGSLIDVLKFSLVNVFANYRFETSYNPVLWTMSFELIGSFLIYAYVGIFRVTETVQWKVALLATAALMVVAPFFACFMLGYLIAELKHQHHTTPNPIMDKALISVFIAAAALSTCFRAESRIASVLAAAMVFAVAFSVPLQRFFSNMVSRFLGLISFPLYLIHVPILCSWSAFLLVNQTAHIGLIFASSLVLCFAASLCLLPVEKFSIKHSKTLGNLFLLPWKK